MDDDKARAIIDGARLIDMTQTIQRLADLAATNDPLNLLKAQTDSDEIRAIFTQLNAISSFRHALIHRGAMVDGEKMLSINMLTAKTTKSIEELRFGIEDIQAATSDLMLVSTRLAYLSNPTQYPQWADERGPHPWRYKAVKPSNWWTRIAADALRQALPPESSPA